MDRYCSHQTSYQPAAGQPCLDYLRLNGQDKAVKECFRVSDLKSRPLTPSEVEEYHRRQARCLQEANSRWARPEQLPTRTNSAFTAPYQGTIPVVKLENGHDNIHRQLPGEMNQHSQRKPTSNSLNLAVEDFGQRQSLGMRRERREYLRCESAEEARRIERMGISAQQYYNDRAMAQRALALPMPPEPSNCLLPPPEPSKCLLPAPEPSNYLLPPALLNDRVRQEVEQRKLAQQRRDEQKREQEKVQLPAAKPGNSYPRPSRISGPVRAVHDDDMERRLRSNLTFSMQLKSSEAYREAYRMYHEKKARKKEDERRKAAVSVPTPEPTRTESVKQLLSSVNKALEEKVEAAELEAADTECLESEALRAQSQQLKQDQNDANQAARQCGESFWYEYSANYPTAGCSSMTTQWSQNSDSAPGQPLMAKPGHLKGEDDLADRIRIRPRRSRLEYPQEKIDYRPATEAIDKVPGDLLETPRTALGQDEPSSLEPPVVSTSRNREKCAADDPHVPLANHKDSSVNMSKKHPTSLPIRGGKETNISPEVRGDGKNDENARETVPLGDLDVESEWEEVDDGLGDGGWSDVEEDVEDDARRKSSDVEWASDVGSEDAFDY